MIWGSKTMIMNTPQNILNISSLRKKLIEPTDCGAVPSKSKITLSPSRHMVQAMR